MKLLFIGSCALIALAGCASSPPAAGDTATPGMTCEKEAPIGSNILVNRCRSAEQVRREREGAQEALRRVPPGAATGERGK